MTCELSNRPVLCGFCGELIPAGRPVYRLTRAQQTRCQVCAPRMGVPLPDIPVGRVEAQQRPLDLSRFDRFLVARDLRGRILDWRAKQSGEPA